MSGQVRVVRNGQEEWVSWSETTRAERATMRRDGCYTKNPEAVVRGVFAAMREGRVPFPTGTDTQQGGEG